MRGCSSFGLVREDNVGTFLPPRSSKDGVTGLADVGATTGLCDPFLIISTTASRCSGSRLLSWFLTSKPAFLHSSRRSLLSMFNSCARA